MEALEILKKYQSAKLRESKDREVWVRCFEYLNNWVDGELGQWQSTNRNKLISEGRPPISFNEIRKFVNRICGAQRMTKLDEKCFPRDDEGDPILAEILSDLLKYVKDINQAELAIAKMFRNGIVCGRGFIRTEWNDELDMYGEVRIKNINPFRIFLIGEGEEYDMTDRRGVLEEIPMDKEDIINRWGHEDEIGSLKDEAEADEIKTPTSEDYGSIGVDDVFDKDTKKLKVLRYQYQKYRHATFIQDLQTGKSQETQLQGEDLQVALQLSQAQGTQAQVINKNIKQLYTCYSVGSILLEEEPVTWKHRGFDITGFFCYTDNGKITGVVQDLLDPQDEKNKRRSQIIHILGTAAKNSYFAKKGALDDIEDATKKLGMTAQIIEVNGNINEAMQPIQSNVQAVPAIIQMEQQSTIDMKEISGLSDASLGIVPQGVKSGRGISALQQPTETIIGELFDNYINSRRIIFTKVLSLIQQNYTKEKRVRVVGDYTGMFVPPEIEAQVQMGLIKPQEGFKIITINKQMGEQKLNDVSVGQYDVYIDQVAQSPTMRRAEFFDKLNMKSLGAPVKWSTIFKNYDGRGARELLKDSLEAEQMQQAMGMLPQLAQSAQQATPGQATPDDLQFNVAGAQSPT